MLSEKYFSTHDHHEIGSSKPDCPCQLQAKISKNSISIEQTNQKLSILEMKMIALESGPLDNLSKSASVSSKNDQNTATAINEYRETSHSAGVANTVPSNNIIPVT